ncbi:hypothetical protein B0J18DRAFT_274918 [Chaetomium sp. MPI-SDFR-AT-0129]|nr:hypothetical protein B0J18DRAFT_274918 [Chaetomium sp. MPI-SDFR-AT-0129]
MAIATPSRGKPCHLCSGSTSLDETLPRDSRVPPIHGLPTEIVAQILGCLDSRSLLSTILAHPLFHATFQLFQQHVLKEILLRLVPPQLLPLAFATYEAESIDYSDWNRIRRLLDRVHVGQGQAASSPSPGLRLPPFPLTHRMVAAIERVHRMVEYFTHDLTRQAIPRFNHIFETIRPATISPSEELRILRAFYRFQLYCNIFGRKAIDSARQANLTAPESENWEDRWARMELSRNAREKNTRRELKSFFWPWPPWANEQLACVFEYLETVITVFFDDVAAHDVEWGWRKVDWVEPNIAIPHRRFLLFNGLGLPYRLRHSDEFEIWKSLLDSADVGGTGTGKECIVTMARSLTESVAGRNSLIRLGLYNINYPRGLEGQASWEGIDDAETLPAQLWKVANGPYGSVLDRTNLLVRDAGYVFWDGYVGEAAEVMERVENCSWTFNGRLFPHEIPKLRRAMRRSWEKRSKIWLEGGRGYWVDDRARIPSRKDSLLDLPLQMGN